MKTKMPVLSDSWEASSLLNLILSESFALIYSGHRYCKSNLQPCARGEIWGIQGWAAHAAQQTQGSCVVWEPLLCLRATHSLVSPNHAFPGKTGMQIPHVLYLDEATQFTGLRVASVPLCWVAHYKLHYFLFSHSIFSFLSENGLSNCVKSNCLFL